MRPTRSGALAGLGAVALVFVGRLLGLTELFAIGAAIGMLLVVCGAWVALRDIDIVVTRRVRPPRVHAGNPCTVELQVRNRARRTTPVLRLRDPVSRTAGADLLLAPIGLRGTSKVAYRLPTAQRGLVTVGPMQVEITDPFGLASSRNRAAPAVEVTVLPHIDDVPPLPRTVGPDPDGGAETGSVGRSGEDFAALRTYTIGDDMRRVHWPSSARTDDDLLVRQDDVPWQGRVCVLLDLRRESNDADTVERAVSAAASILRTHLRRGDHVRLVTTSGIDSGYGMGASHLDGVLEYLAVADRTNRGSLHAGLDLVSRGGSGALVVVSGHPGRTDVELIESVGPAISSRRLVRFDRADRLEGGRRTTTVAVPPGTSFPDAWTAAVPARSGRGRVRRQVTARSRRS